MDEVIDNIIGMQSNYDDIQGFIDSVQMPNTVRGTYLNTGCDFVCGHSSFNNISIPVPISN